MQHDKVIQDLVLLVKVKAQACSEGLLTVGLQGDWGARRAGEPTYRLHQAGVSTALALNDTQDHCLPLALRESLKPCVGVYGFVHVEILHPVQVLVVHLQPHLLRLQLHAVQRATDSHDSILLYVGLDDAKCPALHQHLLFKHKEPCLAKLPLDAVFVNHLVFDSEGEKQSMADLSRRKHRNRNAESKSHGNTGGMARWFPVCLGGAYKDLQPHPAEMRSPDRSGPPAAVTWHWQLPSRLYVA